MTVTSLNSGFELDSIETNPGHALDVALFKPETMVAGEVPELRDDIEIDTLVSQWDDLSYLRNDIRRVGGMSRNLALEAHAIVPEFISDERPLEFFTELPTKTQLTATLEFVDDRQKSILSRILEALKKIIAKLEAWWIARQDYYKDKRFKDRLEQMRFFLRHEGEVKVVLWMYEDLAEDPAHMTDWYAKLFENRKGTDMHKYLETLLSRYKSAESFEMWASKEIHKTFMTFVNNEDLWRQFPKMTHDAQLVSIHITSILQDFEKGTFSEYKDAPSIKALTDYLDAMSSASISEGWGVRQPMAMLAKFDHVFEESLHTFAARGEQNSKLSETVNKLELRSSESQSLQTLARAAVKTMNTVTRISALESRFIDDMTSLIDKIKKAVLEEKALLDAMVHLAEQKEFEVNVDKFKKAVGFEEVNRLAKAIAA